MIAHKHDYKLMFKYFLATTLDYILLLIFFFATVFLIVLFVPKSIQVYAAFIITIGSWFSFCFIFFRSYGRTPSMKLIKISIRHVKEPNISWPMTLAYSLFLLNPFTAFMITFYIIACQEYIVVDSN